MFMYYLIGCVVGMWWMSLLMGVVFLRKVQMPYRRYISVLIAFPVSAVLSAFGSADGGELQFGHGFTTYGIASVILLIIYAIYYESGKPKIQSESK